MTDDRRLVELIDDHSKPKPMSRARQVAFRRTVEERLEPKAAMPWRAGLAIAASAAIAAALWLANGPSATSQPVDVAREESPAAGGMEAAKEEVMEVVDAEVADTEDETVLASYADPDEAVEVTEASDYLPDDYLVIAGLVDELDG